MWSWSYGEWEWNLVVDQARMDGEGTTQMSILTQTLMQIRLIAKMEDRFVWWKDKHDFTVKCRYVVLCDQIDQHENSIQPPESILNVLAQVWRTKIPNNVHIFSWRFILNRLPTRDQLARRGILTGSHDILCSFYFDVVEDNFHVFVGCSVSNKVWCKLCYKLSIFEVTGCTIVADHFDTFSIRIKGKFSIICFLFFMSNNLFLVCWNVVLVVLAYFFWCGSWNLVERVSIIWSGEFFVCCIEGERKI